MNKNNLNHPVSQVDKKIFILGVKRSSKQQKSYMNHLVDRHNNFDDIFESHGSISKRTGISKNSIQRLSTTVSQKGFIKKKSRGRVGLKKNTCQYILPEIWDDPYIRKELAPYIPALQIKKRISSLQSVKNSKYLSWKIIQVDSVGYIKVSPGIISLNKQQASTNIHISNDIVYVRSKSSIFQKGNKMIEAQKNYEGFNEAAAKILEAYPQQAIKHAIKIINSRSKVEHPWPYFRKILNDWCQEHNVEPNQDVLAVASGKAELTLPIRPSSVIVSSAAVLPEKKAIAEEVKQEVKPKIAEELLDEEEKNRLVKSYKANHQCYLESLRQYEKFRNAADLNWANSYKHTMNTLLERYPFLSTRLAAMPAKDNSPVHIANEIAKILEAPIADNSFKAELLKLRERVVYNWAMKSYQKTNEAGEDLAIEYILRKRKLYQEPSQHNTAINVNTVAQEPVNSVFEENEPGCLTINEVDYDEVLD